MQRQGIQYPRQCVPGLFQSGGWSNPIKQIVQSNQANGQINIFNKIMENMIACTDKDTPIWRNEENGVSEI
jgi:hypothetical protein